MSHSYCQPVARKLALNSALPLWPSWVGIILWLLPLGVMADLEVCNDTNRAAFVALGYQEGGRWVSKGWWEIAAKQCDHVVTGSLTKRYYYLYAENDAGSVWDGGFPFCTSSTSFNAVGNESCEKRDRKGFLEVDTNGEPDFTQRLTEGRDDPRPSSESRDVPWKNAKQMRLRWSDHAIAYDAILTLDQDDMSVNADLFDLRTQKLITRHHTTLAVLKEKGQLTLVAEFPVPGDSVTPSPHAHKIKLMFDGKTFQNCPEKCYEVEIVRD
jgi:uncharacterized membrane protein